MCSFCLLAVVSRACLQHTDQDVPTYLCWLKGSEKSRWHHKFPSVSFHVVAGGHVVTHRHSHGVTQCSVSSVLRSCSLCSNLTLRLSEREDCVSAGGLSLSFPRCSVDFGKWLTWWCNVDAAPTHNFHCTSLNLFRSLLHSGVRGVNLTRTSLTPHAPATAVLLASDVLMRLPHVVEHFEGIPTSLCM